MPALVAEVVGLLILSSSTALAESRWLSTGAQRPGDPDRPVWSVSASPTEPKVLLAATQGNGVLRSADGGSTWTSIIPEAAGAWVVRFDADHPGVAYAGTQSMGLWKSSDTGKMWTSQNQGLDDLDVRSLDVRGDLIVVGTHHGVYYSKDAATSWKSLGLTNLSIGAVAILPRASGVYVIVGADNGNIGNGSLLRTQDLTANWTPVRGNIPVDAVVSALGVGPLPQGATERPVLAGTTQGVFRSDDGGISWTQLAGLPATDFNVVLFNPANADQIYVASDGESANGVYRSLDRGSTWSPMGTGLPARPRVTALALQPVNPPVIFAATWNPGSQQVGLFHVDDPSASVTGVPVAPPQPSAAATSPKASASSSPNFVAPSRGALGSPILWRDAGVVGAGVLLLTGALWLRRWYRRREDRRTYD